MPMASFLTFLTETPRHLQNITWTARPWPRVATHTTPRQRERFILQHPVVGHIVPALNILNWVSPSWSTYDATWPVYRYRHQDVVVVETEKHRYDIFRVPRRRARLE